MKILKVVLVVARIALPTIFDLITRGRSVGITVSWTKLNQELKHVLIKQFVLVHILFNNQHHHTQQPVLLVHD